MPPQKKVGNAHPAFRAREQVMVLSPTCSKLPVYSKGLSNIGFNNCFHIVKHLNLRSRHSNSPGGSSPKNTAYLLKFAEPNRGIYPHSNCNCKRKLGALALVSCCSLML